VSARRSFIHAEDTNSVQNALNGQAQARGDFELCIFATHLGGEDRRIATPDTRADHQRVAGDPERARLDTHHELAVEVGGSRKPMSIDYSILVHDRNRGPPEPGLRLALGTPDQAIRAPGAESELRRTRPVVGDQPRRPFGDLPARFVRERKLEREIERVGTNAAGLAV